MAYTKHLCQPVRMESQFVATKLHHTLVQDGSGNNIEVNDGTLITIDPAVFAADPIYTSAYTDASGSAVTVGDLQLRVGVPTVDATSGDICIVDLANVAVKTGQGVTVRDGNMIVGLVAAPGEAVRARMLCKYDTFVISEANCTGALTVGQYAVPAANGQFAPAAAAATSGLCAAVVDKYVISQGIDGDVVNGLGVQAYRLSVTNNEA